jgi:DNA-binding transcriptional ArsR family regulator
VDPFDPAKLEPAPREVPTGRAKQPPRHWRGEKFLRGPIPWLWLERAGELPGKALAVGLRVWFAAGCRDSSSVTVNLSRTGLPRRTAQRGLIALERAGLVAVERRRGRPPVVTILNGVPDNGATANG